MLNPAAYWKQFPIKPGILITLSCNFDLYDFTLLLSVLWQMPESKLIYMFYMIAKKIWEKKLSTC